MSIKKPWEEFNKTSWPTAYCCIDNEGTWFDSGASFEIALQWCSNYEGKFDTSLREQIELMDYLGYSIVSLDMCRKMYEAGLIK